MSCLPLAKVVEEPHAAANICGVVHSILDGVTKRAGKRRVEIVLVDATARVTCVFWEACATATARGVARLDVVTVDVHHATKRGDGGVVCDCRSAARVRWQREVGGDVHHRRVRVRYMVRHATLRHGGVDVRRLVG